MKTKHMRAPNKKPLHMKRPNFAKGGPVVKNGRQYFLNGGGAATGALSGAATGAAVGSVVPGIGTAIGAVGGALIGGIAGSGILSGSSNNLPNITDPVTGQQITNAQGQVVADTQTLANYNSSLLQSNGVGNQEAAFQEQKALALGQGVSPAQAQLAQNTQANVSNQAALDAGQRGASSNVGLIERQNAQQGAATQEQAVGQEATLESQQQLAAINAMGTIAGQQVGETQTGLAQNQNANLTNQNQLLGAEGSYNTAETAGQGNVNSTNTSQANTTQTNLLPVATGVAGGLGTAAMAGSTPAASSGAISSSSTPSLGANTNLGSAGAAPYARGGKVCEGPHGHVASYLMAKGGKVPAMVSPGEKYLSPEEVRRVVEDGENPLKTGRNVPGKAKVRGDSIKNDTVKATLDEGGVILPRHIMQMKGPHKADKAALFVHKAAVHMRNPKGGAA